MRVLIDATHPAHVHFFAQPIRMLRERGHEVVVTSRDKEVALELLDELGVSHTVLSTQGKRGPLSLVSELLRRDCALYRIVKRSPPDVLAAIGGTFIAHVGKLTGIPSLVFYDTENATMQNAITYPFASCVLVPRCYQSWVPRTRHIRYDGYHELSYLHPRYFTPDRERALANGLAPDGDTFLLRLVSWDANHDIGEEGWSTELVERLVDRLQSAGTVIISSEAALPAGLEAYRFAGNPAEMHHVMGFCRAFVGESATMASECAVLGVPAIYAAHTGRGYTDEQESRYGLVSNVRELHWKPIEAAIDAVLAHSPTHWQRARQKLLDDTIDVAAFVTRCVETFPTPLHAHQRGEAI